MPRIKYVLHPGPVYSSSDGDRHFISAAQLARLYKVPISSCAIDKPNQPEACRQWPKDAIHLYPSPGGDYSLPTE